ncbi:MAG: hypothetical protein AAF849_24195 [Bacteroidota bacterium]
MIKVREWMGLYMWTDAARLKEIEHSMANSKNATSVAHQSSDTGRNIAKSASKKVGEE